LTLTLGNLVFHFTYRILKNCHCITNGGQGHLSLLLIDDFECGQQTGKTENMRRPIFFTF